MSYKTTVVVVGGGIAGISCIEALFQDYNKIDPQYDRIVLVSESRLVKRITNYELTGRQLEKFEVREDDIDELRSNAPQGLKLDSIVGTVQKVDATKKIVIIVEFDSKTGDRVETNPEFELSYDILCLCTGSKPRKFEMDLNQGNCITDRVIVIRDTTSVIDLKEKLSDCRRLVIVGNGGISLELVNKISDCEKVWIIRDESIGYTFFDSGAAKFLLDTLKRQGQNVVNNSRKISYAATPGFSSARHGAALGPDWCQNLDLHGKNLTDSKLDIIYKDEVASISHVISNNDFPLLVKTKQGTEIYCDLVVLAIGVTPNMLEVIGETLETSVTDCGILIDEQMRTSVRGIYAAGDVVSCDRWPANELWFQMRLWSQARQMGFYAGRCIAAHIYKQDPSIYFNFECFTHCTSFFGYQLVLLGRYNCQSTGDDKFEKYEVIARVDPGKDYVKLLIKDNGKIIGAVLVGDSGLEETIENLIHDQIDVSAYKDQLLDNTVDIEDYFD